MTQIIDSDFGVPKVGMELFSRSDIDLFSRQNGSWIRYRIEHHLETMTPKQAVMLVAAEVEADKAMKHRPEPFELIRFVVQPNGDTRLRLRRSNLSQSVLYSKLSKGFIPASLPSFVINHYGQVAERVKPRIDRRVKFRKSEDNKKKADELSDAQAVIKADANMNPKIQSARMKMPSYAARINKAAAIINAAR